MSRRIMRAIGTSLLTNPHDRPWKGWSSRMGRPVPILVEIVARMGTVEPSKANAETNTSNALDLDLANTLALLHKYTPDGLLRAVKVIDPDRGVLGVRFGPTGSELLLRMKTNARWAEHTELVVSYPPRRK